MTPQVFSPGGRFVVETSLGIKLPGRTLAWKEEIPAGLIPVNDLYTLFCVGAIRLVEYDGDPNEPDLPGEDDGEEDDGTYSTPTDQQPVKRGRGRPRKAQPQPLSA